MTVSSKSQAVFVWRASVALFFAVFLFSTSCEHKAPQALTKRSARLSTYISPEGGGGGGSDRDLAPMSPGLLSQEQSEALTTRKIIRNGSLELLVNDVGQAVLKIQSIVAGAGGFVEKSTQTNSGGHTAVITVRVPAPRLDQVIADTKKLATNVDRENVEVRDVTRDYIDLDARLRNAQAEEAAYLQIMKRATTIKDTLEVTEKLSDVRGRIEQMQGEMKFLTAQIEMSSLEVSLRSEAEAAVAGIRWRPLRQAKIAVRDMLSGLADWTDSVVAFFIYLPLIALWLLSVVVLLVISWSVLRFLWRRFGPKTSWRLPWPRSAPRPEPKSG